MGSGTVLSVARRFGCDGIGIELNPAYIALAEKRLAQDVLDFDSSSEHPEGRDREFTGPREKGILAIRNPV
jgi:hypothetical protein